MLVCETLAIGMCDRCNRHFCAPLSTCLLTRSCPKRKAGDPGEVQCGQQCGLPSSPVHCWRKAALETSSFPHPCWCLQSRWHLFIMLYVTETDTTSGATRLFSLGPCSDLPAGTLHRRCRGTPGSHRGWECCWHSTCSSGGGCRLQSFEFLRKPRRQEWEKSLHLQKASHSEWARSSLHPLDARPGTCWGDKS